MLGIGSLAVTASYITGLIIPFTFANRYNANLRKNLAFRLQVLNQILILEQTDSSSLLKKIINQVQ
ncbi:P13 family porin [Borreliella tanukii]|uniref:P13 family porin n=1 Tax=Borreliella tanukii TaxID=56146 RepID=UPI003CC91C8B